VPYDKLAEIDQGAVIEHKRLGHALQVAQGAAGTARQPPDLGLAVTDESWCGGTQTQTLARH
jgi:hypothetical protein